MLRHNPAGCRWAKKLVMMYLWQCRPSTTANFFFRGRTISSIATTSAASFFLPYHHHQRKTLSRRWVTIQGGEGSDHDNDPTSSKPHEKKDSNELPPTSIPFRKNGYHTTPMTWDDLIDIIVVTHDLARLSRSVDQEQIYQDYQRDILQDYTTMYDHVLITKFDVAQEYRPEIQKWQASTTDENRTRVVLRLLPNDFPYYCEEGVEHWVLWKLNGSITPEEIEVAKQQVWQDRVLGVKTGYDMDRVIHWENPGNLKSLPEINHIHILARTKI